jgi:GNAT superfamily N-acetyltransferase
VTSNGLRLEPARLGDRDTQVLVAEVQAEYTLLYGGPDTSPMDDSGFEAPQGAFFLGYAGKQPVAMGGWRLRPDVHVLGGRAATEIKRMYVAPGARRRGFARQVLTHLEDTARAAGSDVMVLETGTMQPEAIALYTACGYEPVESFGHYSWSPLSRCFGRLL